MAGNEVDLVVGSIGRLDRLERLTRSLCAQMHTSYQMIVVEQVDPVGAREILEDNAGNANWTVTESIRGLSRARNVGLAAGDGPIVGFPDDDCWYDPGTLSAVAAAFSHRDVDFVIGRQVTKDGRDVLRTPGSPVRVSRENVWSIAMSSAIFARRSAVQAVGGFDEDLGVGAATPYQSGEETDLILAMMAAGFHGTYSPSVVVRHPLPSEVPNRLAPSTGRGYGRGMGRVLAKHGFTPVDAAKFVLRPLIGSLVALCHGDRRLARFRLSVSVGRQEGYMASRRELRRQRQSHTEEETS